MAEGRMLKKAVSDSRRLAELKTDSARLLWTWILPYLDIEGRYFADPDLIKGKVVPRIKTFNANNIAEYLADMAEVGLITLFEYDGEKYLEYRNFKKFQRLNPDRESKSQIPEPENSMSPQLVINEDYVNKKQLSDEDSCNTQQVINDKSVNTQIPINDDSVITQRQLSEDSGLFQEHSVSTQRGLSEDSVITPPQFKLNLIKDNLNKDKVDKNKVKNSKVDIPEHLKEIWQEYLEMRIKKKKPATEYAQKLVISQLQKWYPDNNEKQIECLKRSIKNSWTDVYKLKDEIGNKYEGLGRDL